MRHKNTRKGSNLVSMKTPALIPPLSMAANKGVQSPVAAGMPDVQASSDSRQVPIDKVGVKDVTYPIRLRVPKEFAGLMGSGDEQTTVATISMYVSLPHYQKGTHMSRFLEVLNEHAGMAAPGPISPEEIPQITAAIRERLDAEEAHFEAEFTYFIPRKAPVTGALGLMDYQVSFSCTSSRTGATDDFIMGVVAPGASLCPCSKEISKYGAHNQRCLVEARVRFTGRMWIEDLAGTIEKSVSCPVFAVLKRPDEKYVTEAAYDNPKFVEDIIRDLALGLEADERVTWYSISSENFESIHNHNAYAEITRSKVGR